ncbi:MAG: hypothetical protein ABI036_06125 [Fibrobacteria bacterium]
MKHPHLPARFRAASIAILAISLAGISQAAGASGAPGHVNKRDSVRVDTSQSATGMGPDSIYSPRIPGAGIDSGNGTGPASHGALDRDSTRKSRKAHGAQTKKGKPKSGSTSGSTLPDLSTPKTSIPDPNTGSAMDTGSGTNGVGDGGTGSLPGSPGSINSAGKIGE